MITLNLFMALLGVAMSRDVTYTVKTITGSGDDAGTDGAISIALEGKLKLLGGDSVDLGKLEGGDFGKGKLATFTLPSDVDVGWVKCATLTIASDNAWKVNTVIVTSSSMNGGVYLYNNEDKWMSTKASDGVAVLKLCSQGIATWLAQVKTSIAAGASSNDIRAKISFEQDGRLTPSGFLNNCDTDDFQGGDDFFYLYSMKQYPTIKCIEVTAEGDDAWLFDSITVKRVFPSYGAKNKVKFSNTDSVWMSSNPADGQKKLKLCKN